MEQAPGDQSRRAPSLPTSSSPPQAPAVATPREGNSTSHSSSGDLRSFNAWRGALGGLATTMDTVVSDYLAQLFGRPAPMVT